MNKVREKNCPWISAGSLQSETRCGVLMKLPCGWGGTCLMKDREMRSHDTIPWSISSKKAVRVKASISPKLQDTNPPLLLGYRPERDKDKPPVHSLGAALHQTCQCADALHVDELCGEGRVRRQLGEFFQGLQSSVDAVGLDPLQELTGSASLQTGGKIRNETRWDANPVRTVRRSRTSVTSLVKPKSPLLLIHMFAEGGGVNVLVKKNENRKINK